MITIYTTQYCGYCVAARRLLSRRGYAFDDVDVGRDFALRARVSQRAGGYRMVPLIFIGEEFIGGYDELALLDRSGRLAAAVAETRSG